MFVKHFLYIRIIIEDDDYMEVREAVSDVLARWRHLAGALGVKPGQTSTIEASNRGAVERCMEESDNLLASQDVFIRSYIHLMSTTQLDRSRSPTMPCILLVISARAHNIRVVQSFLSSLRTVVSFWFISHMTLNQSNRDTVHAILWA